MKYAGLLILALFLQGCFPVSIPPNLEKGKLIAGQKFKRKLPDQYAYIFTDSKDANQFYYYLSAKFPPNEIGDSESNVPVVVDNHNYYISFYETEKKSRVVNLIPAIANEIMDRKNVPISIDEPPIVRGGTWYIALMISDEQFNDALSPQYHRHQDMLKYAKSIHQEYLGTRIYESLQLEKVKR